MQVTETLSQGLKREYKVVLPAQDLATRLDAQLSEMKDKAKINGFRPGKVPMGHLKRMYGRSAMGELLNTMVNEANRKVVEDNGLRLATEPKMEFPTDQAEMEKVLEAKGDLAFTIALEVLPSFDVGSFSDVSLERITADVADEEVAEVLKRMSEQNRTYVAKEGTEIVAEKGDKVTIDFTGKLDGVPFEGGTGGDIDLVLGSNSFIPGFEDQVEGIKAGESRTIKVTFPAEYNAAHLAGKEAEFDVVAKAIAAPGESVMDEEFAKGFGFEDMDKLKEAVRGNIEKDFGRATRDKLKRQLLDALDAKYSFDLPETLVEQEFNGIWTQVESEQKQSGKSFEDEGTTEEAARADYRRIAERRVRLGLVLAEVGEKAGVQVSDDEVTQALVERARQFPGQEKMVWDYYRSNPQALAEIRAPLFEEKVVDHIVAQATVSEKKVSKDELFKVEDDKAA